MAVKNKDVKQILDAWIDFCAPEKTAKGEVTAAAKAAGISPTTIRQVRNRKSLTVETLVRLFLARGVSVESLINLPQTEPVQFSKSLTTWNKTGAAMNEKQRAQYIQLVDFLRKKWVVR